MAFFVAERGTLFFFMLFGIILTYAVWQWAKRGKKWDLRRLPAVDAMAEGVGRAVELGRPVHFSAGVDVGGPGDPDRTNCYPILSHIARMCAEKGCRLIATVGKPDVLPIIDQIVKEAAVTAGNPEWYNPYDVRFLGEDQYVYSGGVMGILQREQVAFNLIFGYQRGTYINLTESGRIAGAFQIGGIARMSGEIGVMVLSTDYCLFLEEVVAGAAYVSGDPLLLGTVAAQDYLKFVLIGIFVVGALLMTAGIKILYNITMW